MTRCSQCSNEAMFDLEGHPVCLHCYAKYQQIVQSNIATLNEQANYVADQVEAVTGMYGVTPRYPVRRPVIHTGPMTLNSISVNKSVVGSINTGTIQQLDVALTDIKLSGNPELQTALTKFAEAALNQASLDAKFRNDLLERITFISTQLAATQPERQESVLRVVLESIANTVTTVAGLSQLWQALRPLIEKHLGTA